MTEPARLHAVKPLHTVSRFLVERGLLTAELAHMAEEITRRQGGHIVDTVLKHHFTQEETLARVLAEVNEWAFLGLDQLHHKEVLQGPIQALGLPLAFRTPFLLLGPEDEPTLILANPYRTDILDQVGRRVQKPVKRAVAPRRAILGCLIQAFPTTPQHLAKAIEDLERAGLAKNAVSRYLGELIGRAVCLGASDIHVEPGEVTQVRFRVHGLLRVESRALPATYHEGLANVLEVLAGLETGGRYATKEGRLTWELPSGDPCELRVIFTPTVIGQDTIKPQVVMRVLHREQSAIPLAQLGYPHDQRVLIEALARQPHGLVLLAGQVNSGKSTTLYAILSMLQAPQRKIVTIEDPVETLIGPLVQQHQVNDEAGFTYAAAIRAFLRVDPDVMLVGEIRDPETAVQIVQASLTGKLSFSTIHAESAVHTIPRLLSLGVDPIYLASALKGVVAQRLVRVLCPACRVEVTFGSLERTHAVWYQRYMVKFDHSQTIWFPKPGGCERCGGTGYRGLTVVAEVLVIDPQLQEFIEQRRGIQAYLEHAKKQGYRTMQEVARELVARGVTDFGEAERVLHTLVDYGWTFTYQSEATLL